MTTPPRWDLTNVYPSLESPEFQVDFAAIPGQISTLESFFHQNFVSPWQAAQSTDDDQHLAIKLGDLIDRLNTILEDFWTLRAYIASFVSTDSFNETARRRLSELESQQVRLRQLEVRCQATIGKLNQRLPALLELDTRLQAHAFKLREYAEQSRYLMSEPEEMLAAELSLSGAMAWSKLQGTITSQLSVDFELDGQVQKLPLPALINLRSHPDQGVRQRAYEVELAALKTIEEPLAAAMNGVKGEALTIEGRRGRTDALHSAIDQARIDRATLEAMIGAIEESLPTFWRYYHAKAARLGKSRLAWWDLFAPLPSGDTPAQEFTFDQAADFILEKFAGFSPDLVALAKRAIDEHWIDAEQRRGKRGGAFCMSLSRPRQSRILCNFDGSLDQVFTIAHELGHAFHNECLFAAGKTELQRDTPMTLAETASILCETIMFEAVLAGATTPQAELRILETSLTSDSQVIVDIYSRFLFEKAVFEKRASSELSASDLSDLMLKSQATAYGDGLDPRYLNKYMWTWKPHYYRTDLSFYNFPYAYGLLFGLGLYAIYQQRGPAFVPAYQQLLASTGEADSASLAARFGIDIRGRDFWRSSLKIIADRIEKYCRS